MNQLQAGAFSENYSTLGMKSSWSPVSRRLLRCSIGDEEYFLDMSQIAGVGRGQQLQTNEERDGPIGWINIGEARLPVFRFGGGNASGENGISSYVVVRGDAEFAIQVDRIMGNTEAASDRVRPLPRIASENGIFTDVVRVDDRWMLCADPTRLDPDYQPNDGRTAAKRTRPSEEVDETEISHRLRAVLFSSAGDMESAAQFALSISQVHQVMELPSLLTVPGAPGYLLGILNWRGIPVPVVDLGVRLGLSQEAPKTGTGGAKRFVMIVRSPGFPELAGVVINQPPKVVALPISYSRLTRPLSIAVDLTAGVFESEGRPLIVPDLDVIMTERWQAEPVWL